MVAINSTLPLIPIWRASLGYSGCLLTSTCAWVICPPVALAGAVLAGVAAGDAVFLAAGAGGGAMGGGGASGPDPKDGAEVGTAGALFKLGASGRGTSAAVAGRSRWDRVSVLKARVGTTGLEGAGSSCALGSSDGAVCGAPGAGAGLPLFLAAASAGGWDPSGMGEGRVRKTRTDSLVVLLLPCPAISILKLTSAVIGE